MYSYMLCVFLPERRLSYIIDVVSLFAEFNGGDGLHQFSYCGEGWLVYG